MDLYYSNRCKWCKDLLQIIDNTDISFQINQICIDNMTLEDVEQIGLEVVPTIVVYENNTKNIFDGQKAFKLLLNYE